MRFLKLPGRTELHAWTPILAARGDMVEVRTEEQPILEVLPNALTEAIAKMKATETDEEPAAYLLKSAGFGRYKILDRTGNVMVEALPKAEAEAKLAELNA